MGVREGLLTLLAAGPKHGYQLKLELEAAAGDAWTLNIGQVYTTLQRLERDHLVEQDGADTDGRISYRITPSGVAEARQWFATPARREVSARDEVAMKIKLALTTGAVPLVDVLRSERDAAMQALQDYTALKSGAGDGELAWLLHLDRLIYMTEAEVRWLDLTEERVGDLPVPADYLLDDLADGQTVPKEGINP